jgi:hypothetical protein
MSGTSNGQGFILHWEGLGDEVDDGNVGINHGSSVDWISGGIEGSLDYPLVPGQTYGERELSIFVVAGDWRDSWVDFTFTNMGLEPCQGEGDGEVKDCCDSLTIFNQDYDRNGDQSLEFWMPLERRIQMRISQFI